MSLDKHPALVFEEYFPSEHVPDHMLLLSFAGAQEASDFVEWWHEVGSISFQKPAVCRDPMTAHEKLCAIAEDLRATAEDWNGRYPGADWLKVYLCRVSDHLKEVLAEEAKR
jgi:hypothetical protein